MTIENWLIQQIEQEYKDMDNVPMLRSWITTLLSRIHELEEGIAEINELVSNREKAILLGPGWTIANIIQIINNLLKK